jgi:hypothetical protein
MDDQLGLRPVGEDDLALVHRLRSDPSATGGRLKRSRATATTPPSSVVRMCRSPKSGYGQL